MLIPQLPPFRLYGLIGCPHCVEAETYLRTQNVPAILIVANDDPIAQAGVEKVTGASEYPVLCCTLDNSIVRGFNRVEFERLSKLYHSQLGISVSDGVGGEQQPSVPAPTTSPQPTPGA